MASFGAADYDQLSDLGARPGSAQFSRRSRDTRDREADMSSAMDVRAERISRRQVDKFAERRAQLADAALQRRERLLQMCGTVQFGSATSC